MFTGDMECTPILCLSLRTPIACTTNKQYLNGGSGGADLGQAGIQ